MSNNRPVTQDLASIDELSTDPSRVAVATAAAESVEPNTHLGLGSGKAIFLLTQLIAQRLGINHGIRACVASPATAGYCKAAGIEVVEIDGTTRLDLAIDGADEIDPHLRLIKGKGAALLREKLLIATAQRTLIIAQIEKSVSELGERELLPVEIVPYAWQQTQHRVAELLDEPALRVNPDGSPVVTADGGLLLDGKIHDTDIERLAARLDQTLGVVDHGLFLDQADEVFFGHPNGTTSRKVRD